jgi:hypothetical protein
LVLLFQAGKEALHGWQSLKVSFAISFALALPVTLVQDLWQLALQLALVDLLFVSH